MTIAHLRALQATIASAIDEIEGVYAAHGTDFPGLDAPYYPNAGADQDKAEALRIDPTVFAAANRVVAACGQITATVHKPWFTLIDTVDASVLVAYLGFIEATHVVDILREAGPTGLDATAIAHTIDETRRGPTGDANIATLDPAKVAHILRALATNHWLREVRPGVFANNRVSSQLDSGKTVEQLKNSPETKYDGTDGTAAYAGRAAEELMKFETALVPWLLETGGNPKDGQPATPFNKAYDTALPYYPWLEQPGNESRLARFGHAMNGTRQWEVEENVLSGFPWADLPKNSVVVDVGGGIGSMSVMLAQAFPHLRFVVQDRAGVVAIAPKAWGTKHSKIFAEGRVSFQAQDFFAPYAPLVASCTEPAVFLVRAVAHNWPDAFAIQILKNIRAAAGPSSKLLLVDNLLPYACPAEPEGEGAALAPEGSQLLPNLGRASSHAYLLDGIVMSMLNAQERTHAEMEALARAAGWRVAGVRRAVGSLWAYVTAEAI